jgi:hypothetical protein
MKMSKKVFSFILSSTFLVGPLFHKHFTVVTYSHSKISWTINCIHAPMQCFQNALAYLATAVSYMRKMFLKLVPGVCIIKLFFTNVETK